MTVLGNKHYIGVVAEQRKNKRFELRLPFELTRRGSQATSKTGETQNMSSGGVLFTTEVSVDVGDAIEYMITLPKAPGARSDVHLRCIGKVVRSEQPSRFAATLERYEFMRQKN